MTRITRKKLEAIFKAFRNKRVLIIGDVMLDEYLIGKVIRISPEAPVPVIEIEEQRLNLGGAANVGLNIANLGCIPVLIGIIGDDQMGNAFRHLMIRKDLFTSGIVRIRNRPTTVKTRIIGHTQHVARVDREVTEYVTGTDEQRILRQIKKHMEHCHAVILQDYNKGVLTPRIIEYSIQLARRKNILITVDPKFTNFLKYKKVSLFKPNIKETEEALAIKIRSEQDLILAGHKLLQTLSPDCLLITRGAGGMSLMEARGTITHVPTRARNVADVSGAGDTVISTLTAALVGGASYREAATLANYAAGIVCEEVGIVPIDKQKLYRAYIGQNI